MDVEHLDNGHLRLEPHVGPIRPDHTVELALVKSTELQPFTTKAQRQRQRNHISSPSSLFAGHALWTTSEIVSLRDVLSQSLLAVTVQVTVVDGERQKPACSICCIDILAQGMETCSC